MRLFVAIFPPEPARADLHARLAGLPRRVRLTRPDRWHLTLAFLGEVPDDRVPEVERALDGVDPTGPIELRISGGGAFGRGRSAVQWAGISGEVSALTDLHAQIRDRLTGTDDRPLTPHLTVAYARSPEIREALADYAGPAWTAEEFMLVRSLHREGGGYRVLRSWPLGRAA